MAQNAVRSASKDFAGVVLRRTRGDLVRDLSARAISGCSCFKTAKSQV